MFTKGFVLCIGMNIHRYALKIKASIVIARYQYQTLTKITLSSPKICGHTFKKIEVELNTPELTYTIN